MLVKSAKFVISNTDWSKCPAPVLPEYGFIGRSNVGKSSLINMLAGQKDLAKTSAKPGKTQLINHFIINNEWYLVDLPGYGYAEASKEKKAGFERLIRDYILKRENLLCLFVLIDSRLPQQTIDAEFMEWLGNHSIPFVIVFTKTDKLSRSELEKNIEAYKTAMLKSWEEVPTFFLTSANTGMGKENVLAFIEETNKIFKPV